MVPSELGSSSSPPPSLGAQLDVLNRGQGGSCSLEPLLTISLSSQLIYGPPSSARQRHPPPSKAFTTLPLCTLSLSLPLSLSLLSFHRRGVRMPAARSSGDKSDLPGRVIVKHPPGRLRPPHPFNSSAGTASRVGGCWCGGGGAPPCCREEKKCGNDLMLAETGQRRRSQKKGNLQQPGR